MILRRLVLRDFRNYQELDISFDDGLNYIYGSNGAGKTNLVEAVSYLSIAKSWRTNEDDELIRDSGGPAIIKAEVVEGDLNREILISISKGERRVTLNGKPVRKVTDLAKLVNVIVFSPTDVTLFQGSPAERRSFLNVSLSKSSFDYMSLITRANNLLKQRNALLKSHSPDMDLLDVLTSQLIEVQEPIINYRRMYVASINEVLPKMLGRLRGVNAPCELVYRSFVKDDGSYAQRAQKAYKDALEGDLIRKSTSVGVHREDFSLLLNGKDISSHGSQGENRLAALALKLCPFFLIGDADKKPICVLDDVTSELDPDNTARLFELVTHLGQTFITATSPVNNGGSLIEVSANTAIRRN